MRIQVKTCGLSTPQTIDAAIKGGASHIGFVFFDSSPRNVSIAQSQMLAARIPAHIARVAVMVDPADTLIDAVDGSDAIDIYQLHKVTPARAAAIAKHTGKPIWAAIGIKRADDLKLATMFAGAAQRIVFDAKTPDGALLPGGMGIRFDWELMKEHRHTLPWALSGGLDARNLAQAVGATGANMIDVSSGLETSPGIKDVDKIAAFLKEAAHL